MFNQVKHKMHYYIFTLITHPLFLLIIITTFYALLFIYFFADTVLCQGLGVQASSEELPSESISYSPQAGRISELKDSIEHYTAQANKCKVEYLRWRALMLESIHRPETHEDIQLYLYDKASENLQEYRKYWSKTQLATKMLEEIEKGI